MYRSDIPIIFLLLIIVVLYLFVYALKAGLDTNLAKQYTNNEKSIKFYQRENQVISNKILEAEVLGNIKWRAWNAGYIPGKIIYLNAK